MKGKTIAKILTSKPVKYVVANAPKFLTGFSIATSIAALVFTVKGTILAVEVEKQRKEKIESGELPQPEHPRWETVKTFGKCLWPAFIFESVSIGSRLYGTNISTARTAMATAACKASELAFEEYRSKVEEKFGSDKEEMIRQEIVKSHAEQSQVPQTTLVVSPYDEILFKEALTGQVFRSDVNTVKSIFNKINYSLSHGYYDYISVMEYLDEFGISSKNEEFGWNVTMTGHLLEPRMELSMTDDGRPCLLLSTIDPPYEGYNMYN